MSQANVEIVRRGFAAYARGDVEAMLELVDSEAKWKQIEEPVPVHGHDGIREALGRWHEMWDDLRAEAEEFIDAGECVVVLIRYQGLGKASGARVDQASYHVFKVMEGRIVRMVEYGPGMRAEALQAAGLRE